MTAREASETCDKRFLYGDQFTTIFEPDGAMAGEGRPTMRHGPHDTGKGDKNVEDRVLPLLAG